MREALFLLRDYYYMAKTVCDMLIATDCLRACVPHKHRCHLCGVLFFGVALLKLVWKGLKMVATNMDKTNLSACIGYELGHAMYVTLV